MKIMIAVTAESRDHAESIAERIAGLCCINGQTLQVYMPMGRGATHLRLLNKNLAKGIDTAEGLEFLRHVAEEDFGYRVIVDM